MAWLSDDLRQRVVEAFQAGQQSYLALGRRFSVSASSVRAWVERAEATGSVSSPRPVGRRPLLDDAGRALLCAWIAEQNDLTLAELVTRDHAERGVLVSDSALSHTLQQMGLHRKKRSSTPANRSARTSKRPERLLGTPSRRSRSSSSSLSTKAG